MLLRSLHSYVGILIAPAMIFFALTGLLQVYGLHEAHPGYTPPPLIEKLAMVHKNQRFSLGRRRPPGDEPSRPPAPVKTAPGAAPPSREAEKPKLATVLLKAFFALVSAGLFFSTAIGIWMGLRQGPKRTTYAALLAVGTLVPVVLAALSG